MTDVAERFQRIAAGFTARAEGVGPGGWDAVSPCEGWLARDIVRHMAEWVPGFLLTNAGVDQPAIPSADVDPLGAWIATRDAVQGLLDDPAIASKEFDTDMMGRLTIADAVDRFASPDVFVHTWDLARATGQDETLDPVEVRNLFAGMEPMDAMLRGSGQFGARIAVSDDADDQTKLIAFLGRRP